MPPWCAAVDHFRVQIVCLTNGLAMSSTFLSDNLAFLFRNSAFVSSDVGYNLILSTSQNLEVIVRLDIRPSRLASSNSGVPWPKAQGTPWYGNYRRPKLILGPILFF